MEDFHGHSFAHPLVENRDDACILSGLSFSYTHSRWGTDERPRWNRRALFATACEERDAAEAEAAALRLKLQAMHRRAQKAEGLSQRSANLLETIMLSVRGGMKPGAKLPLHSLFHRVLAARDHARASSGRAWIEGWHYLWPQLKDAEAERDALRERVAQLEEKAVLWIEQGMVIVAPEGVPQRMALESYRAQFASLVRAAITDGGKT